MASAPQVAMVVASMALVLGCGSKPGADTYAKAAATQRTCCENLQGADRDSCLNNIIKIEDEQVAATKENRATFSCVQNNFACDPATGHATKESAQLQLDCIQGLN